MSKNAKRGKIDPWLFFPPLLFIVLLCVWVLSMPEKAANGLAAAYNFVTGSMGWFFEFYIFAVVIVCVILCITPLGKKRLGDEPPEFSTFSWLGMIFTAVAGFGVLTWTSIEWFYYAQTPTWGMEPYSAEAMEWASIYPLHHWGPVAFAIATLMGVVYAYHFYCKKSTDVRPSSLCIPVIGEKRANGPLGKIFDIFFAIALLCSVVCAVGVNVPTLFGIIGRVVGHELSFTVEAIVIIAWSVLMAILLYTGLKKGIRFFSDFRVWVGFGILIFLVIVGPKVFIGDAFIDSIGMYLQNFMRLTLNTNPYAASGTPQAWTVFYWCWYIALAIQTGLFFAKVSKGRTIRQLVIGALAAQTLGSWLFFAVFQNFSIYTFMTEGINLASIIASKGQGEAIMALWDYIPFAKFLFPVLMVYGFISMQTLLNGQCYSMALATSKTTDENGEPPIWTRIFWSLGIGAIAICLLILGGIKPSQTVTIVGAVPVSIVIVIMVWAFFKDILKKNGKKIPTNAKRKKRPANRMKNKRLE